MYEIYSVFGRPFQRTQLVRERVGVAVPKRRGKALSVVFGTLALVALFGSIAYGTGVIKLPAGLAKVNITLPFK